MTSEIKRRGILLVLSSPSGAGKTSISRAVLAAEAGLAMSVSVTTRPRRAGETDGVDYRFIDRAAFDGLAAAGGLLEHAAVFGHFYGTPRAPVMTALEAGADTIGDVDWQGTQQLKSALGPDLVSVFILPPSLAALEERLRKRAQDSDAVVAARMEKSAEEMSHWPEYDYVVLNRELADSVAQVRAILAAERLRRQRQLGLADFVNRMRGGG